MIASDSFSWVFDAPTGTYRCPELSKYLLECSREPGPILPWWAAVKLPVGVSISTLHDSQDVRRVLIYQARYLRQITPFDPELRVAMPANFGRDVSVAWYNIHLDRALLPREGYVPLKEIRPEEVL